MPLSPDFLYETTLHAPDAPPEPALVIGPRLEPDGSLAYRALTPRTGPFPQTAPPGVLRETPFGFLWSVGTAPAVFQLVTRQRFDAYWRAALPGPFPSFTTNEDVWRWFSERYGEGWPAARAIAPPGRLHVPVPPGAPVPPPVPAAPEPPPPPAWASAMEAWAARVRRHRAEEDAALVAALEAGGEAEPARAERLCALGAAIARAERAGPDRALIAWLQAAPSDARLTTVAAVLHAAWSAAEGLLPVSAATVEGLAQAAGAVSGTETRAAVIAALEAAHAVVSTTREAASATLAALRPAPAESPAPPATPPPASQPSGAIDVRQVPASAENGADAAPAPPAAPPPAVPPPLVLVIEDGDAAGRRVPLVGRLRIGRHAACDLALPDMEVSRQHAVIERDAAGQTTIRDTNSANGTFVNGARAATHTLHPGDRLTLGQTHLRVMPEGER